jgi:hypothetical protein
LAKHIASFKRISDPNRAIKESKSKAIKETIEVTPSAEFGTAKANHIFKVQTEEAQVLSSMFER